MCVYDLIHFQMNLCSTGYESLLKHFLLTSLKISQFLQTFRMSSCTFESLKMKKTFCTKTVDAAIYPEPSAIAFGFGSYSSGFVFSEDEPKRNNRLCAYLGEQKVFSAWPVKLFVLNSPTFQLYTL